MASIRTGIELHDGFTSVMNNIISTVQSAVVAVEAMQGTMNADMDTAGIEGARTEIDQTVMAVSELEQAVSRLSAQAINVPQTGMPEFSQAVSADVIPNIQEPFIQKAREIRPDIIPNAPPQAVEEIVLPVRSVITGMPELDIPESVTVPVEAEVTQQPELEVPEKVQVDVEVAGGGEYRQQVAEITGRMEQISRMQQAINDVSGHMYILPKETAGEINGINRQIVQMEQALNFLEQNPFHLDASVAELQIKSISAGLDELSVKQQKLDSYLGNIPSQTVQLDIDAQELEAGFPDAVRVPVEWQTDSLEVFSGSGMERFRQEVQSADAMLQQLCSTQDAIARQAYNTNLLPPETFRSLNSLAVRMDGIRDRIRQIEGNPLNMGTDLANRELEQLRGQLNQLVNDQNDLTAAMAEMDVSAANAAYLRLSQTVSGTERYIRDNVDEQGRFNQEIQHGTQQADNLMNTIKRAAAAYVSIQSAGKALSISDELVQTTSRLSMMNDGAQTTQELVNMVYAAAQDARGSFSEMADVVARFGNNAKDAFGSSEEVVAFADLIQKQMTIAGASTQEASNAMLQLSQALGSGVLRGDELNSIFEQAPNLIQNIADYIQDNDDVARSMADAIKVSYEEMAANASEHIRDIASEGLISADMVKQSIFAASDEINSKFKQMPITWGQTWQSMQNTALIAFQPVLQRLNDIANSESFQVFVNGAVQAMAVLAGVVLDIFGLVAMAGSFIKENWSVISPVIYGVIAALALYVVYQGITTAATAVATAAQWAWNAAMEASPITWIIVLIIALVAVIFAVCNAIADMTGAAESGFGIIAGCVNVGIEWFKNLGLTVANIALGITMAILAVTSNMKTAFHNAVVSVQAWFYDLMYTVLATIDVICAELNKLPFVEFDHSGVTSAAHDYAVKAQGARDSREDYVNVANAFNTGNSTFDTWQDGWAENAFAAGAAWGDGAAEKVSSFSLEDVFGSSTDIPNVEDYTSGFDDVMTTNGMAGTLGDIADNTGSIKDSLDCTEEDLRYLRDIAEQDAVNRFTIADVKVEQTNYNDFGSGMDLDGVISELTESVKEAADSIAEGVHE